MMEVGVYWGQLDTQLASLIDAKPSPQQPNPLMIGWNCVAGSATSVAGEAGYQFLSCSASP
jgi:hypothetical protein